MNDLGALLDAMDAEVPDPSGTYNGDDQYCAVFFLDPDDMRLEGDAS